MALTSVTQNPCVCKGHSPPGQHLPSTAKLLICIEPSGSFLSLHAPIQSAQKHWQFSAFPHLLLTASGMQDARIEPLRTGEGQDQGLLFLATMASFRKENSANTGLADGGEFVTQKAAC